MKTTVKSLIAVLIFIVPVIASAQGRGFQGNMTPEEKAEQMSKHMYAQLDLSKEQLKEIETINLKHVKSMEAARKDMEAKRIEFQAEMKEIRDNHEEALENVLTEKQYKELLKMQHQRQHQRDGNHCKGDRNRQCR